MIGLDQLASLILASQAQSINFDGASNPSFMLFCHQWRLFDLHKITKIWGIACLQVTGNIYKTPIVIMWVPFGCSFDRVFFYQWWRNCYGSLICHLGRMLNFSKVQAEPYSIMSHPNPKIRIRIQLESENYIYFIYHIRNQPKFTKPEFDPLTKIISII